MDKPKIGSLWTHKNGRTYKVKQFTNVDCSANQRYPETIVYQEIDSNMLYSRPLQDWHASFEENLDSPDMAMNDSRYDCSMSIWRIGGKVHITTEGNEAAIYETLLYLYFNDGYANDIINECSKILGKITKTSALH